MLISELRAQLESLEKEHGDLPVSYVGKKINQVIKHAQYRGLTKAGLMGGYEVMEWIFLSDEPVDLRDHFNFGII